MYRAGVRTLAVGLDAGYAVRESLGVGSAEILVGREPELALAAAAMRRLRHGHSAALVVEGEAGIGKTRFVQSIVEDARAHDTVVFSGQAHPFERSRPFGVLAAALDLDRRSGDRSRAAIGALLAGRRSKEAGGPVGGLQFQVVEEIVDLVESSCAERPMVLVVEDVHWADSASVVAVSSLVRRLPLAPLLVVVTARPAQQPPEVARLLDDLGSGGASLVRLRPLQPGDVTVLASQRLGAEPGPTLTSMLAKAGGNPLWVAAMLRTLADEGMLRRSDGRVDVTSSDLPASLSELVIKRLQHLPPGTLELLQVTAVLGDAVSLRDVAAVARRSPAEVVGELNHAFESQLLAEADGRVVFRHQLVHDAIYGHMPRPVRQLLHREAAVALMAAGADILDVADHLMLGAERGDEEAAAWLRDAAREASGQAPLVTLELVSRAEALLPGGHPEADVVSAEVVQALLRAGRVTEASARAEAVLARRHDAALDIPLRLALLGALALQNRAGEVIAVAEDTLEGPTALRPTDEVMVLAQQSWAFTYTGDPGAGEAAAARGLVVSERADDAATQVWALTALLVAVGRQGRYDEALLQARRAAALAAGSADTRSLPLQPKYFLGLALFDCDLVDEARTAFRAALDDEFGSAWWLSETLMADAQASFAVGGWEDALPNLVAGGLAAQEKGNPLLVSQSLAYRTVMATGMGNHRAAGQLVDGFIGSLESDELTYNAGILAFAAAGLRIAEGNQQGAYDLLLRCWRYDVGRDSRFYHRLLAPDLVRTALALGQHDVASEVADTVTAGVALAPGVPTVSSLAMRCRGLVSGDIESLMEAVAQARLSPLLIDHAGACEDAAALLLHQGYRDDGATLLAEALSRYESAGADAWAGRVRAELRTLGHHPSPHGSRLRPSSGWDSLTDTELAVSSLVAEGLTNGAVARRLYISPHTVNTHLRHVFAKLGVSNRVELARVVDHSIE
jgi:DNA-binding CsgD family transcriptional regulator/tetratricopeptide (TPR) repeat protein